MSRKLIFRTLASVVLITFLGALATISLAQESKWTKKADMPTARYALSTSVVGGKIYAIGGAKTRPWVTFSTVEEYDPKMDRWTKKADMPTARLSFTTSVANGKIYAIGGEVPGLGPSTIVEEYDPAADEWMEKSNTQLKRFYLSSSTVNGKVYVIGGLQVGAGVGPTAAVEEYDPITDTWTWKADMPTRRNELSTSVVNGKIYAIGGVVGIWPNIAPTSIVEEYDPATDTWRKVEDMPTARTSLSSSAVDGKIYAIGGQTLWPNMSRTVEEYRAVPWGAATGPSPADRALHPDTWVILSWWAGDFALSHDVYFGDNFDDVNNGLGPGSPGFRGNQATMSFTLGFPGFPYPDGLVRGSTYYWRIDEVNDTEPNSPWKGPVWSFSIPPKTAYNPDPADGAEFIDLNVELSWTAGLGAGLHTVYFGDNLDNVSNAAGGLKQGSTTYTPGLLEFAKTYYWRVDEFTSGRGGETHKGDVWSFTTQGAVGNPDPSNGAVDVTQTPVLTWVPGVFDASHQVYFGPDAEALKNADTSSPEYQGTSALGDEILDPGKLTFDTTYYWRVDEVNNTNPDSPWAGNVWSFTTADFIVVDDFEDYDIGNNEIWWAWKDGSGYASHPTGPPYAGNGTGSSVGDESTGSYTEEIRVHGGSQAMPYWYDNNKMGFLKYSEVEKTLTYPRDWTENGVSTLSIWFAARTDWWSKGVLPNAAEPVYVALNSNAVVYHDNPDVAKIYHWMEWRIDLQAFADLGVDLTNVDTIALGFGDRNNPQPGGSGLMFFDDIRLYRP